MNKRRTLTCMALWAGVLMSPARAADVPVPLEHFFQRPAIQQLRLSPSGRQLAFTTGLKRERVGLVVMNLDAGMAMRWVAAFDDADIDHFRWVNDERLVFDVIDFQQGSGEDDEYAPGLYSIKSDGTGFRQLIRQPELWSCGIQWLGVADLELFLKGSWWVRDDLSDRGRRISLPLRVARLPEDAALVDTINPVRQAGRIKAPLLMAYGDEDLRVPLAHGERMRDALRQAGRDPEWVVYPGEGHGWRLMTHQIDFASRVDAFLARHLPVAGR